MSELLLGQAWKSLELVMDPEYPISVVDLGLLRGLSIEHGIAHVKLTFTSMGCPWTDWIERDITQKLLAVDGIEQVEIEIVWDRPWSREDLSPCARISLRRLGISP